MNGVRVFAFGGGWQSTAALVLAAQGEIDSPVFVMANVGDGSSGTSRWRPCTAASPREGSRSLPIPVRMSNGAPGTRSCTADFKIKVIGKELKRRGASADNPATVGVGISVDEISRVNNRRAEPYEQLVYPLLANSDDADGQCDNGWCMT